MKQVTTIVIIILTMNVFTSCATKQSNDIFPVYKGADLGITYSPEQTKFRIWAPTADEVVLRLYEKGKGGEAIGAHNLEKDKDGTWLLVLKGDKKNLYYTFQAFIDGKWKNEVPDPQAMAVGVNGNRGMIVDFSETNPEGWEIDSRPTINCFGEIVIWEIHMRDFSIHESSGSMYPGKFLAFTESGTKTPGGKTTMVDHLVELGITHVHLLPVYDFYTVDETRLHEPQFNWGYDPKNFNAVEGSYSTDPFDGRVRIKEFKQMVQALHRAGIRVIMDVVYNHMYDAKSSAFEQLVPGYFFRMNQDGTFSNGSGCGNETASEKPMMRKFMIESLKHWATEYRIDGFRIDLMGLHDIETMNQIRKALDKIDPKILLYGEGWTAGDTPLPQDKRAVKHNAKKLNGIAVFSDDIRDAIRGHWYDEKDQGFMVGRKGVKESIKFGVVAATKHPEVDYKAVNYSDAPYAKSPLYTITYVTCHDNPVLWDKTVFTCDPCSKQDKLDIQKLANGIVLTSQGIAFLHAGEEIVRTKFGEHNSYNLPDSINQLIWTNKEEYHEVFEFYRDMVKLRRNHPAFRMPTTDMVQKHLSFLDVDHSLVVGFHIGNNANGDKWKHIVVFYNSDPDRVQVELPEGRWRVVASKYQVNEKGVSTPDYKGIFEGSVKVPARSILVLVDQESI